jgi:hypothetical protein
MQAAVRASRRGTRTTTACIRGKPPKHACGYRYCRVTATLSLLHIQYTGVLDDAASTSSPAPDQCTAHGCSGGAGFTCSIH